jgi:large subunit ribosomal protein L21
MYAIIQEGGGQRKVEVGQEILVDLIDGGAAAVGAKVNFDKVLVIGDGKKAGKLGEPFIKGASVSAEVLESLSKGDKIYIHKFRTREGYRRKTGHRQKYTAVKITAING